MSGTFFQNSTNADHSEHTEPVMQQLFSADNSTSIELFQALSAGASFAKFLRSISFSCDLFVNSLGQSNLLMTHNKLNPIETKEFELFIETMSTFVSFDLIYMNESSPYYNADQLIENGILVEGYCLNDGGL